MNSFKKMNNHEQLEGYLSTKEVADRFGYKANSVRCIVAKWGDFFGAKPIRGRRNRFFFPIDQVEKIKAARNWWEDGK